MKRIITAVVTTACLVFAGTAAASVDTNLAASVKRIQENYPKWVVINGTHTAANGQFTGALCARQIVVQNRIIWEPHYFVFNINTSVYGSFGTVVDMGSLTTAGKTC